MIRPALPADIPAILAIWNPIIRDTAVTFNPVEKTPQDLAQMLSDKAAAGHGFRVAEYLGMVVGFGLYGPCRGGGGWGGGVRVARSARERVAARARGVVGWSGAVTGGWQLTWVSATLARSST